MQLRIEDARQFVRRRKPLKKLWLARPRCLAIGNEDGIHRHPSRGVYIDAFEEILPGRGDPSDPEFEALPHWKPAPRRTLARILCSIRRSRSKFAEGGDSLDEITINEYARQLLEAHGDRAVAEASQRAVASEQRNDKEEAETWRHIEAALKVMRGPIAS
jgi:hypothetical protein